MDTIFEYGCASGPNLVNIDQNIECNINYFGYDILCHICTSNLANFQQASVILSRY